MFKSICFDDLTDVQRQCFHELGIGPGDRVYIQKRRRLTDDALRLATGGTPGAPGGAPSSPAALATSFERDRSTINRRLRRLRGIASLDSNSSSEQAGR